MMFKNLVNPYLIAEISGNHNGSIEKAMKLIKLAKENGADCVKLQTYTPETMTIDCDKKDFMIEGGLWDGYKLWDLYDWAQTPFQWQKPLFEYAQDIGITCISTPFDETAVDLLEDLNCPFYKIASFELTDLPLVEYVARTKKPIILSTGMADEREISEAVEVVKTFGSGDFVLLHCVSGYPTPIEEINLATINLLRKKYNCEIGLSDHTLGNSSAILSIAYGAKVIEKHLTLDRSEGGPDADFSMEPEELKDLSSRIKEASKAIGKASFEKKSTEKPNLIFRRSLYITKDIKKGEIFTKENLKRIRPGYGLEPKFYNKVLGLTSSQDISRGEPLQKKHITEEFMK